MANLVVTFPEENVPGRDPVGAGDHLIREGECISFLAAKTGLKSTDIFEHPANATLREVRGNPNVLLPGDRVALRQIDTKDQSSPTDRLNRFQLNGEPVFLRLSRILADGSPALARCREPGGSRRRRCSDADV